MREKIEIKPGQPVRTVLDQTEGKPVDGRNGPQYMRVVDNDQRIMFVEPGLEEAIVEAGAVAGDAIRIVQRGRGKTATWEVGIIADTAQGQPRPTRATAPQPAPQREISNDATQLTAAFVAAIEATAAAEQYAGLHNLRNLQLSDADTITRCALSIYIQRTKEGR